MTQILMGMVSIESPWQLCECKQHRTDNIDGDSIGDEYNPDINENDEYCVTNGTVKVTPKPRY